MKKAVLFFAIIILLCGSSLFATILLTDDFTGTVGTPLTANGWTARATSGGNPMAIADPGLVYAGYLSSGIGHATSAQMDGEDVNKAFTSTSTGSIYYSFLVNAAPTTTTAGYSVHLCEVAGTGVAGFYGRFYLQRDTAGNLRFGLSKISATGTYTGYNYAMNTTYLIVIKYEFRSGPTNDVVSMWVNPALGSTEPVTPTISVLETTADPAALTGFCFRQWDNGTLARFDGVRTGTSWVDVGSNGTLPVELSSFTAIYYTSEFLVKLQWTTESETNNLGFNVFRSDDNIVNHATQVNVGLISGTNTTTTHHYSIVDNEVEPQSTYYYWLQMVDFGGTSYFSNNVMVITNGQTPPPTTPDATVLKNAYPNPFNIKTSTNMEMEVKTGETATLTIYNILGQSMKSYTLHAGTYNIQWNGLDENGVICGSGIYFYNLKSPSVSFTKKMVIVK